MIQESRIEDFLKWCRADHSPATVSSYKYALASLDYWLTAKNKKIVDCTLRDLMEYYDSLENRGLRGGTRAIYMTALKTLWKWLYRQELVLFNETLIPIPTRVDTKSYPFLDQEDYNKIMESFDDTSLKGIRNQAIIAFLYATGLRLGELLSLNIDDIDVKTRSGIVTTFKRKNHKRQIFWDQVTNQFLRKWIEARKQSLQNSYMQSSALFIATDTRSHGVRLCRNTIQRIFRKARARAGIDKNITAHSCRHGFASKGVKNNINIRYLQVMMGHAQIKNTMIYMGYKDSDVEKEYKKIYELST